jgi:hypothetical protein
MFNIPSRINSSWYFFTVATAQRDCAATFHGLGVFALADGSPGDLEYSLLGLG